MASDERLEIARRVMRASRHEAGRHPLLASGDGVRHVIACLATDTIEYAAQRVSAAGGAATVVVPSHDLLVPLHWTLSAVSEAVVEGDHEIASKSTLGMLVDYLRVVSTSEFSFRITTDVGGVDITGGDQLTVPA